jgi:hypothetical protein
VRTFFALPAEVPDPEPTAGETDHDDAGRDDQVNQPSEAAR